jgi:hypothetical protein
MCHDCMIQRDDQSGYGLRKKEVRSSSHVIWDRLAAAIEG